VGQTAPTSLLRNRTMAANVFFNELFTRMMEGLAAADAEPKTIMIDATYLTRRAA